MTSPTTTLRMASPTATRRVTSPTATAWYHSNQFREIVASFLTSKDLFNLSLCCQDFCDFCCYLTRVTIGAGFPTRRLATLYKGVKSLTLCDTALLFDLLEYGNVSLTRRMAKVYKLTNTAKRLRGMAPVASFEAVQDLTLRTVRFRLYDVYLLFRGVRMPNLLSLTLDGVVFPGTCFSSVLSNVPESLQCLTVTPSSVCAYMDFSALPVGLRDLCLQGVQIGEREAKTLYNGLRKVNSLREVYLPYIFRQEQHTCTDTCELYDTLSRHAKSLRTLAVAGSWMCQGLVKCLCMCQSVEKLDLTLSRSQHGAYIFNGLTSYIREHKVPHGSWWRDLRYLRLGGSVDSYSLLGLPRVLLSVPRLTFLQVGSEYCFVDSFVIKTCLSPPFLQSLALEGLFDTDALRDLIRGISSLEHLRNLYVGTRNYVPMQFEHLARESLPKGCSFEWKDWYPGSGETYDDYLE